MAENSGEISEQKSADEESKTLCQPCSKDEKKSDATVFCSTCGEYQCTSCSKIHSLYSFMKNHKLTYVNFANGVQREETVSNDIKGIDRCEKHENKLIKKFCEEHNELCCSTCAITDHRTCKKLEEIKGKAIEDTTDTNALRVDIFELIKKCKIAATFWTGGGYRAQEMRQELLKHVSALKISVIGMLDDLEKDIQQVSASVSESKVAEYRQHCSQCDDVVSDLTNVLEVLDTAKGLCTPEQLFIAEKKLRQRLNTASVKADKEFSKLEAIQMSLELNTTFQKLINSKEKLGSLGINREKINIKELVDGRPVKLEGIASTGGNKEMPIITGMDFLSDGRLVGVDNRNCKCLIYSKRLEILNSFNVSEHPHSIVALKEDEVALTYGGRKKIEFLRVSSSNEISLIRTIKTSSSYSSICVKDEDHFLAGAIDEETPVRIVSFSGEEKDPDNVFPSKRYTHDSISCAYIKTSAKLVLCDKHGDKIYIYDESNKTLVTADVRQPTDVAIGPSDSILVCSRNSIVQFSQTGRVMSLNDPQYPCIIAVSSDRKMLAVANICSPIFGKPFDKLHLFRIAV